MNRQLYQLGGPIEQARSFYTNNLGMNPQEADAVLGDAMASLNQQNQPQSMMQMASGGIARLGYQMGGVSTMPMDYGQSLQVPQQMPTNFSSAQNITMNPLLNYGQPQLGQAGGTPLTMAGGGIANLVEREKYGIGSKIKKFVRNIIPNEISEIAVKAAPFVAPFNPLLAAGMAGIGGFDQTGRIGSSLKSAALTYGAGQLGRYVGGAGFQEGFNPFAGYNPAGSFGGVGSLFTSPIGTQTGLQLGQYELFGAAPKTPPGIDSLDQVGVNVRGTGGFGADLKTIFSPDSNVGLETRAQAAMNLTGDAIKAMYTNKDGSLDKRMIISTLSAIPSYLDAKKKADQIGLSANEFNEQIYNDQKSQFTSIYQSNLPMESFGIKPPPVKAMAQGGMMNDDGGILSIKLTPVQGMAMGGEIPVRQNQSGVSELDLRAKGGYIPVGIKEKADDVPAMLSKNEFVFTANAVRGAGGGDINKGAQKMYKLMKSLEKKIKKTKVA